MAERFDVIIIGGGAAGLSASLYAARRGLTTLVLSQDIGGQAATTGTVENYPGTDLTDGLALMMTFKRQAEKYGAAVKLEEVIDIQKSAEGFTVTSIKAAYQATAIILAHGLTHKRLNVPGEEQFIGRGVSYCATCDAPLFKGKPVMVVGGGNSAMDAALLMSKFATAITIGTVNSEFRGERVLMDRMSESKLITTLTNIKVITITGTTAVEGITLEVNGIPQTIPVGGVFVEIGFTVNPKLMAHLAPLDQRHQVIIDPITNGTSVPGLFAAGDVTNIIHKQIVISAGEGAKAALGVDGYLQSLGRKPRTGKTDWGVSTPFRHEDSF